MINLNKHLAKELGVEPKDLQLIETDGKIVATSIKDGVASQSLVFISVVPMATPEIPVMKYSDWLEHHKFSIRTSKEHNSIYHAHLCTDEGKQLYACSTCGRVSEAVSCFGLSRAEAVQRLVIKINNRNDIDFFARFYLDSMGLNLYTSLSAIIDLRTINNGKIEQ